LLTGDVRAWSEREVTEHPLPQLAPSATVDDLRTVNAKLAAVLRIGDIAGRARHFDELIDGILQESIDGMEADWAAVLLAGEAGRWMATSVGLSKRHELRGPTRIPPGGIVDIVVATGQPFFIENTKTDPRVVWPLIKGSARSILAAPLRRGDESLGVVCLAWRRARREDPSDRGLLQIVADRCAAEILAARLYDRAERELERSEELTHILQDERDVLSVIMDHTGTQLAYLDPDFNYVSVNRAFELGCGMTKEQLVGRNHFELWPSRTQEAALRHVRDSGRPLGLKATRLPFPTRAKDSDMGFWDWTLSPVKDAEGRVLGLVLSLTDVTEDVRSTQLSDALNDINVTIGSKLDVDEIMHRVVTEASRVMSCESTTILMREGDAWVPRYGVGVPHGIIGKPISAEESNHIVLAARTKHCVAIDDAAADERMSDSYAKTFAVGAALAVPLLVKDDAVGVVCFHQRSDDAAFSDEQVDFAGKLGASVSLALESARLYASLTEELHHVQLLQDVAVTASAATDVQTAARGVLEALSVHLPLSAGNVRVLDDKHTKLHLAASLGLPQSLIDEYRETPLRRRSTLVSRAVFERRILTHEDRLKPGAKANKVEREFARAHRFVVVPIAHRDEVVGTYSLVFEGSRPFSDAELGLFYSVAHVMGQAIENAMLLEARAEAQQRATRELDVSNLLRDAANVLSRSLNTSQVLNSLADVLTTVTAHNRVIISLIDRRRDELTVAASRPDGAPAVGTKRKLNTLPPECARAFASKQMSVLDFGSSGVSAAAKRYASRHNIGRCLVVPLALGDRLIGQIEIDEVGEAVQFTQHETKLVEGIASQAAVVLENARLHEGSVAKARSLEVVSQAGRLVTSTLRMREALAQILDYSSALFRAQAAVVLLADEDAQLFKVVARHGVSWKVAPKTLTAMEVARLGFDGRGPLLIEKLRQTSRTSLLAALAREGYRSAIIAPLRMGEKIHGFLAALSAEEMSPAREELAAFRLFADQAATAIKNAETYEREHRIARILQESLTGPMPDIKSLAIGIAYESAYETERVGGDFYDVLELDDELIALLIGDVSGKGVRAAGLTETIRSSARTLAFIDPSPAFVFTRLNQSLLHQLPEDMFATAQLLVIDARNGELRCADAGHPVPLVCGPRCYGMDMPPGMPLGIESTNYRESYAKISKDDTVLLYTDGVLEARRSGELYGDARLRRALSYRRDRTPQDIVDGLLEAASRFADGKLADDVALLAFRLNHRRKPAKGRSTAASRQSRPT